VTQDSCHICQLGAGASQARTVFRDEDWTAASPVAVPGWVMLFPNRHEEGVWELTDAEAKRFGPLVLSLSKALRRVCEPECIYVMYAGETARHFHAMLMPRGADVPAEWRGPGLVGKHAELADAEATDRVIASVRKAFEELAP
jgi:diadenosine tetraphosphate (Ap4A) HIT family hydrolase